MNILIALVIGVILGVIGLLASVFFISALPDFVSKNEAIAYGYAEYVQIGNKKVFKWKQIK